MRQLTGVDLSGYKANVLQRRLLARAREAGAASISAYLDRLEGPEAGAEARLLVERLSVRVSSFLRDPAVFRALEQHVYPDLFAQRTPDTPLQLWCVGCSRGQEPYSLALTLTRWAERHGQPPTVRILATDVDAEALEYARRGEYPQRLLEGLPSALLREAFAPCAGGGWRLQPRLRQQVTFRLGDALRFAEHPRVAGGYDLISCRNLLIYLSREAQEALLLALLERLRPGGYLLLGATETVLGRPWRLLQHIDPAHRIYRRPE